jgi:hypothetical protein
VEASKVDRTTDRCTANALAGISLLLALAALLFLTFWTGYYEGEEVTPDGAVVAKTSASLIEQNGMDVLGLLALPVVIAAVGFATSFWRATAGKVALWTSAVLLALFALGTGFTVGMFYLPAGFTLVLAAVVARTANKRRSPRSRVTREKEG